jgi:hypothetical protein
MSRWEMVCTLTLYAWAAIFIFFGLFYVLERTMQHYIDKGK